MWNCFYRVTLREERVTEQALPAFEIRVEFERMLERRNRCRVIALFDQNGSQIDERGGEFGIEFTCFLKFDDRSVRLDAFVRLHAGAQMLKIRLCASLQQNPAEHH